MSKKEFKMREALERIDVIKGRLNEMAENLESDKQREDFTDAEKAEQRELMRELTILQSKVMANTPTVEVKRGCDVAEINRQMREHIKNGQRFELRISRDWGVDSGFDGNASTYASGMSGTNPFPITTGDIVEPLWKQTILSAIGSPLLTGLKGNYQWPVVEAFEATVNDEGVALGDTAIPLSKLIAKPERCGIAVPITREAFNETDDLLRLVATKYIPMAMAALMNKIMFSQTAVANATNLIGPFCGSNVKSGHKLKYTSAAPTLANLTALKGVVLGENIIAEGLCYVMNEVTKAELEGTPKWSGSADAIVDGNGRINGVPVFCTNWIEPGQIYFGAFKYAPQGIFGDLSMIVDPYTLARKNAIDFVLNCDYAITVLRKEAFAMLHKHAIVLDLESGSVTAATGDGHTLQLNATPYPAGSTVTWASSNSAKATVSNKGLVTGVASGSANITASITVDGVTYTATCAVTVS